MTTPFGETVRHMREERGITQKQMADALGVSPAYLSALEHGKRGTPSFDLLQRIAGYFGIIWDDVEELIRIAAQSRPRVVVDTSGLSAEHTLLANRLAAEIAAFDDGKVQRLLAILDEKLPIEGKSGL